MTRARYKLLKYSVVIVPIAFLFFSPFSDSLRRRFVGRYDLRWYSERDQKRRVQEIIIHNDGDEQVGKVRVRLNVESGADHHIADFNFTKFKSGYPTSFLDSVASSDLLKELEGAEMKPIATALYTESEPRSLYAVERAMDSMLGAKLKNTAKPPAPKMKGADGVTVMWDDLTKQGDSADWPRYLNQRCDAKKYPEESCKQARGIVEWWAGFKRRFVAQTRKNWSDLAGAAVSYQSNQLSPSNYADYTFDLGARETGLLKITYDPNPELDIGGWAEVVSSSAMVSANRVESRSDLDASLAFFLLKYHFWLLAALSIGTVIVLTFAWPEIRPKQLLPMNKVVQTALGTDDHEYWEHIYQRYRFYIMQQFRKYRHLHSKQHLNLEPEFLLDFVRDQLTAAHYQDPSRFKAKRLKTEQRLNRFVRSRLQRLIILANEP